MNDPAVPPSGSDEEPVRPVRAVSRTWTRAAVLFGGTMMFAVFPPVVLVTLPFALLVFLRPGRRFLPLIAAGLGTAAVLGGAAKSGMWYVERSWTLFLAGAFAALSLRWPQRPFLPRALGAVALSFAAAWALLSVRVELWPVLEWMVTDRLNAGLHNAMEAMRLLQDGAPLPAAVVSAVYRTAELQADLFPAMLGLSSLAALGVSWWLYVRLVQGRADALGPLRQFRFHDQLVWVLVAGGALVLLRQGTALGRAGLNTLFFMIALYMVRGVAVVADLTRGLSAFGWIMLVIGIVFLPPFVAAGAFVIGLGDTWLDVRTRARRT